MVRCEYCFELYKDEIAHGVCPHCGYHEGFKPKDPRYLPVGTLVNGRYVVGGVIGDGGFGITYRVWDQKLQVCMALKEYYQRGVVNRIPGTTEVFVAAPDRAQEFYYGKDRLLREAQIVSKFQSAAIVRVNDYFEENGTTYMVMEFLDCPTLSEYLQQRNKPLEADEVQSIGSQLCEALQEIHAAGVIHRDIAPDNIFISADGKIKIIDFGSARLSLEDTVERLILVKEGFSPIEQYEVIDLKQDLQREWTDLYAAGATLYYCLTGVRPEESRVRKAAVDGGKPDIREPAACNPNVPENLNNTIMKAMAINIHERFKTAAEMRQALQGDVKVLPLAVTRRRKRAIRATGIGCGLLAAVLIMIGSGIHGKVAYDDVALDAADITVWYRVPSDGAGESKTQALQSIVQTELDSAQFDQVTVELVAIPEDEYAASLEQAHRSGTMPTLFECVDTGADYMSEVYDVSRMIDGMDRDTRACWFLKEYQSMFSKAGCIPTGFQVPVLYINTALVSDYTEETVLSSMADLLKLANGEMVYKPIAVDPVAAQLFEDMFPDYREVIGQLTVTDRDAFLNAEAAVYLATTADFTDVRNHLSGSYAIAPAGVRQVSCIFSDFWSISACSPAEQAAAEVLLAFFYTDNAQDYYYLRTESNMSLPLNQTILAQYDDVHWQLASVTEDCGGYVFQWYELRP